MRDLKSVRPLDAAIGVALVLVVGLGAFLAYSVWASNRAVQQTTPATRAIADQEAAVRKDPNNIVARMNLAQTYAVAGRELDAAEQYKAALKIKKEYAPALAGLGFLALKQQEWATGENYFRQVVDELVAGPNATTDPQLETAYFYLGTALMQQKEYEEAASHFKAALRIRRDASDTHYALAVTMRELGSDKKYRESLENALLFDPRMPEANLDYGNLLLEEGDTAGAAEHFRVSADAAPLSDKPRDALAGLGTAEEHFAAARKVEASDAKKALVEIRVAAALDPQDVAIHLLLGQLWEKNGDKEKAATAFRRVLTLDATNEAAKAALKRVADGS